jgi:hypothetical protein
MLLKKSIQRGARYNKLNRRYLSLINVLLLILPAYFVSCKKDFKIALENSIKRYISGEKNALTDIEENLINAVSILKVKLNEKPIVSKMILTQDKDSYEAIYPQNFKINKTNMHIRIADYNNEIAALSDGLRILVTGNDGNIVKILKPGNKDSLIKDIIIIKNRIIYYLDEKLHYFDYRSEENGILHNEKLSPPYTKYYTVSLSRTAANNISVVAGAGGLYYLYLYNRTSGEVFLNKYKISTPKILHSENNLFLIKGNSGNWKLIKFNIENKNEELIDSFSRISDIEIIPEGYLYHIDDTLWYKDFQGNKTRIPFNYSISGMINKKAIIQYNNRLFIINWEKMESKIKQLKAVIPEIFAENNK